MIQIIQLILKTKTILLIHLQILILQIMKLFKQLNNLKRKK